MVHAASRSERGFAYGHKVDAFALSTTQLLLGLAGELGASRGQVEEALGSAPTLVTTDIPVGQAGPCV